MAREDFGEGDRVINIVTKRWGTVVEDDWGCCLPEEVAVVYDGESGYIGTHHEKLFKLVPAGVPLK